MQMNGLSMLLKTMGIDPEVIQAAAKDLPVAISKVQQFDAKLNRILEILEGEVIEPEIDTRQQNLFLEGVKQ